MPPQWVPEQDATSWLGGSQNVAPDLYSLDHISSHPFSTLSPAGQAACPCPWPFGGCLTTGPCQPLNKPVCSVPLIGVSAVRAHRLLPAECQQLVQCLTPSERVQWISVVHVTTPALQLGNLMRGRHLSKVTLIRTRKSQCWVPPGFNPCLEARSPSQELISAYMFPKTGILLLRAGGPDVVPVSACEAWLSPTPLLSFVLDYGGFLSRKTAAGILAGP